MSTLYSNNSGTVFYRYKFSRGNIRLHKYDTSSSNVCNVYITAVKKNTEIKLF